MTQSLGSSSSSSTVVDVDDVDHVDVVVTLTSVFVGVFITIPNVSRIFMEI